MTPTNVTEQAILDAAAGDTATFSQAVNALHVHLIAADFTPGKTTDFTALTAATFTGSAAKSVELNDQETGKDPLTGRKFIQFIPPVGGWYYECTVAPGAPETIYGYCVTDNANAVTYGSAKLATPVTIAAVGDSLLIDKIRLELATNGLV